MANEFVPVRKAIAQAVDSYLEEKGGVISWDAVYDIAAEAALSAHQSAERTCKRGHVGKFVTNEKGATYCYACAVAGG